MARTKLCKKTGKNLVYDERKGKWRYETKREAAVDRYDYSRAAHVAFSDLKEFVSPVDGTLISSRSRLRHHNRGHGVEQVGNDFKPGEIVSRQNAKAEEVRRIAKQGHAEWV